MFLMGLLMMQVVTVHAATETANEIKPENRGRSVISKPPALIVDPQKDARTLDDTLSRKERSPEEISGVTIEQKLGATLPMDLQFTNELGETVTLGDYFKSGRPVVLNLGYFQCPMLCGLVLNATLDVAKEMDLKVGKDYDILSVSFDPRDTAVVAKLKKQNYLKELGQAGADKGWHFLVGKDPSVKALTETVGFGYRWNPDRQEYVHAAALMILTPDGQVSRYLYGVKYVPRTTRLSLVEASQSKIGNVVDSVLLYCFLYDANKGRYTLAALNIMRAGGVMTVLLIGSVVLIALRRERKKQAMTEANEARD
jgi:protein SCO1/2